MFGISCRHHCGSVQLPSCTLCHELGQVATALHGSRAYEDRRRGFAVHIVFRERATGQDDRGRGGFSLTGAGFWRKDFAGVVVAAAAGLGSHTAGQDGLFRLGGNYTLTRRNFFIWRGCSGRRGLGCTWCFFCLVVCGHNGLHGVDQAVVDLWHLPGSDTEASEQEPEHHGQLAHLLGVQAGAFVELVDGPVVAVWLFAHAGFEIQRAAHQVPFVDGGKRQVCDAAHVQMAAAEHVQVAVDQHGALRDQDEVDTHVSVRLQSLDIFGHHRSIGAGRPDFLHLVEDDDAAGLGPFVPVAQAFVVAAVDELVIELQAVDVGVDGARVQRDDAVDLLRDMRAYKRLQQLLDGVQRLSAAWCTCDDGDHVLARIDAKNLGGLLCLPDQ